MKRVFSLLFALLVIFCTFITPVFAEDTVNSEADFVPPSVDPALMVGFILAVLVISAVLFLILRKKH